MAHPAKAALSAIGYEVAGAADRGFVARRPSIPNLSPRIGWFGDQDAAWNSCLVDATLRSSEALMSRKADAIGPNFSMGATPSGWRAEIDVPNGGGCTAATPHEAVDALWRRVCVEGHTPDGAA